MGQASHDSGAQVNQTSQASGAPAVDTIKMYQDIVDRAHAEVKGVREVYKWLSFALGLIISTGIAVIGFLTYSNIHDMRTDVDKEREEIRKQMKQEVDLMNAKAKQDYGVLANDLTSSVQKNVHDVEGKVNKRIDDEFNKDNIQNLVKINAQEHIDKVADNLIGHQIQNKIAPQIALVGDKLSRLDQEANFLMISNAAEGGDRVSYEQLIQWSNDKTYPMRVRAQRAIEAITSKANTDYLVAGDRGYPWKPGTDPSKLGFEELKKEYKTAGSASNRSALVSYMYSRDNILKKNMLEFLLEVICTDNNLDVSASAGTLLGFLSSHSFENRLDCKAIKDWYATHGAEIK